MLAVATFTACLGMSIQGMADTRYVVTDKDDVQHIIDTCDDRADNKVEIIMKPGIYPPIKALSSFAEEPRYISLIGNGDVIIQSDDGRYISPAAELRLDGDVKNITFVSSHKNGTIPEDDKGAYAVHADYGSQRTQFVECTFLSFQNASVGMGLTHDSEMTFDNCKFINRSDEDISTCWKLGAMYAHTDVHDVGKEGAKLNIKSCTFEYPEESYDDIVVQELFGSKIEVKGH